MKLSSSSNHMRHHVIFLFLFGISNLLSLFLLINSRESNFETMHQCHYCNQIDYRIILNSTICQYLVIYLIRYTHPLALCICSQTIGTVTKSNRKIIERGKVDTLKHKYMTAHFPDFVHAHVARLN